jgi:hypothetical protein
MERRWRTQSLSIKPTQLITGQSDISKHTTPEAND